MKNVVIECALNAILISANTSQILAIAYLELFKDKLNNLEKVENDENFTTKYSQLVNKKKIQKQVHLIFLKFPRMMMLWSVKMCLIQLNNVFSS